MTDARQNTESDVPKKKAHSEETDPNSPAENQRKEAYCSEDTSED